MLRKKKRKPIQFNKLTSLIAVDMQIVGDVLFKGGLKVNGTIEGNVIGDADEKNLVILSENGRITGSVRAYDAVVAGEISGDVEVTHFLELHASARIAGNIRYHQVSMEGGALVEGSLLRIKPDEKVAVIGVVTDDMAVFDECRTIIDVLPEK